MPRYQASHSRASRRRKRRKSPLGIILVILLVLAVLAAGGFALKKFVLDPRAGRQNASVEGEPTPVPVYFPTPEPSIEPTPTPVPTPTPAPTPPPIFDDGSDGYMSEGLYIWNNKAFELFYGSTEAAGYYAERVSHYKELLGDDIRVYNMVVPNHSEFGLPERIRDDLGCTSQRQNLTDIYTHYTADVIPVDVYDALNLHNDEYLYLGTDTHWSPLGAFYAYQVFCEKAGVKEYPLESMEKTTVEGFTGYLAWMTGEECLYDNPDHIDLYVPNCSFTPSVSYDGDYFEDMDTLHSDDPDMGYSMVIYGDTPLFRVINHDGNTGRKLVMVKDSYGNAMVPFLIPSFDEVHVADFRDFPGNLADYCEENGITDVLFFSNVMPANTYSQVETMDELFD